MLFLLHHIKGAYYQNDSSMWLLTLLTWQKNLVRILSSTVFFFQFPLSSLYVVEENCNVLPTFTEQTVTWNYFASEICFFSPMYLFNIYIIMVLWIFMNTYLNLWASWNYSISDHWELFPLVPVSPWQNPAILGFLSEH